MMAWPWQHHRKVAVALLGAMIIGQAAWAQEEGQPFLDEAADRGVRGELERELALPRPETRDPQELCIHLHKRGMASFRLGRYEESIGDLKEALSLNQPARPSPNNWCYRWRIQLDLSNALAAYGDHFAQIEHLSAVADELRNSNTRRYLLTQLLLMNPYAELGMLKEVDAAFGRATDALPEVKQRRDWAYEQHNVMNMYQRYSALRQNLRGNFAEAERSLRAALTDAREYLAVTQNRFGDDSQVVRVARVAIAATLRQLASTLSVENKLGEAEYFAREALEQTLAYSAANTTLASSSLAVMGAIKLQQGRMGDAQRYIVAATQALERSQVDPASTLLARRRALLGLTCSMQGRWPEASKVFDQRDQGLRSNPKQFTKFGSRNLDWAMVLLRTGQTADAVDMLNRLLEHNLKKPFVDALYVAYLRGYLAVALGEQGDDERALKLFRPALATLLDSVHDDGEAEDAGLIRTYRTRLILEGYLELLGRLQGKGVAADGLDARAEAFRIADIARNSSVQRAVTASAARASIADPELARLARSEQDASNRIQVLNKLLVRLVSADDEHKLSKVIADIQRDLEKLVAEHSELKKTITRRFPDYAGLVDPRAPAPEDIQKLLTAEEAVIAVYCGERQSYVWTITPVEVGFRIVSLTRADIAGDVGAIRQSLDLGDGAAREFEFARASKLYAALLAPDAPKWAAARMITIMPHAELGQLPFSVLLTSPVPSGKAKKPRDYAGLPWLIKQVAIVQQPSAASFVALRRPRPVAGQQQPLVGFGDPAFSTVAVAGKERGGGLRKLQLASTEDKVLAAVEKGSALGRPAGAVAATGDSPLAEAFSALPALPDTSAELADIASATGADRAKDLYLGTHATESNVKSADLSRFRIVAFATHGLVPGDIVGLDEPALAMANPALSGDTGNDGFLTLEEVLGLKLDADWVILSACNTASSDGKAGEAVSGLGRAFFYAGARSLLVSNWSVETVSARMLTTGIFRHQGQGTAQSRAESLRQSMLDVMGDSRYGHPAFWAPFSLVGDGRGR